MFYSVLFIILDKPSIEAVKLQIDIYLFFPFVSRSIAIYIGEPTEIMYVSLFEFVIIGNWFTGI